MTSANGSVPVVIVGVDGSAESVATLRWAANYAAATGATTRVLLCWHFPSAAGQPPVGVAPKPVSDEVRAKLQEKLDQDLAEAFGAGAPGNVQTSIEYGHPAQVLVDASEHADLLVVGQRGHGGFTGMLIGSVSIHCVTHAHCPVVVVRGG